MNYVARVFRPVYDDSVQFEVYLHILCSEFFRMRCVSCLGIIPHLAAQAYNLHGGEGMGSAAAASSASFGNQMG